ncbi:glycerophosphoryl diester phosphodiesterase [Hymenobacter roseosalivarius DSM 11622]|uniref:Glycerophosphoryl diester phosphodiesterase n=1 Tax=Hymenobacter roseosalivarius DSM 11622 TaxID=645990 RepID=A0A1W1W2D6_9BACT|nr:glycerophosphodiester phosphodiesterase family protein [Hymenobacter roseosalivarius]SMB99768.1 glycerophosphoryl diester phosphodiesterase [Hymenobacter roseosalivarius DSM 11622]
MRLTKRAYRIGGGVLLSVGLLGAGRLIWESNAAVPGPLINRHAGHIQVIGHAGSGFFTPLNPFNPLPPSSMAGVEKALAQGADGVEIDVQLSQDSIPILYHDPTLNTMTTGRGCVSQQPAAALVKLPYRGGWGYDLFQDERIVTLETLLARAARYPQHPYLHLDLHEHDGCGEEYSRSPALVRALAALVRRYKVPPDRLFILTTYQPTLRQLKQELPRVPLGLEVVQDENLMDALAAAESIGVQAIVMPKAMATPEQVGQVQAAGFDAVLFGGRSAGSIRRLVASHPDAIEVDNVSQLLRTLQR